MSASFHISPNEQNPVTKLLFAATLFRGFPTLPYFRNQDARDYLEYISGPIRLENHSQG